MSSCNYNYESVYQFVLSVVWDAAEKIYLRQSNQTGLDWMYVNARVFVLAVV